MNFNLTTSHLLALCIVGAAAVACTGNGGWGWLVFLAVIVALRDDRS